MVFLPLDITIVGCGLGGLAAAYCLGQAGHKITVLESAPAIAGLGAGIQLGPNVTRLLIRWGLGDKLREMSVAPEAITFRRWETGERIGWTQWGEKLEEEHGAPYYHIHRADLMSLLHDLAKPFMTLRLNSKVVSIDPGTPSLTLESGQVIKSDLIIGSDGVKSTVRKFVLGNADNQPTPTGDLAYRMLIPSNKMLKDPVLKPLIDIPEMTGWLGPGRHVMGYCVSQKEYYNVVAICPYVEALEDLTEEDEVEKMRAQFANWEPRVQNLLALVSSTLTHRLMDQAPLNAWVHKDGKVALLGDACHPMLPCRAQGSAMAVEDAAVLGNLFSGLVHRKQIPFFLRAYQAIRHDRTVKVQYDSRLNRMIFHMDDGAPQELRDEAMRKATGASILEAQGELLGELESSWAAVNPTLWANKAENDFQFNYDPDVETKKWEVEQKVGTMLARL